ncbi:hypothetical protein [Paraburkholderia graminis]|uniref:hypothetical protein n=1 Tax=Paraburkholderia graminis TaxID=60548 RepID=UPI00278F74BD|nr:hypothetical protein [Paraburkholderia graminis]MDQ0627140.1 hypothetical protein [Paraburkholderia graminis]
MKRLLASIALAALCATAQASFLDGNTYRQLSGPQKLGYIEGSIDGLLSAGGMARVKLARVDQLNQCLSTMHANSMQVRAIVDRYVEANPEYWGDGMTNTVWLAMRDACQKAGSPLD